MVKEKKEKTRKLGDRLEGANINSEKKRQVGDRLEDVRLEGLVEKKQGWDMNKFIFVVTFIIVGFIIFIGAFFLASINLATNPEFIEKNKINGTYNVITELPTVQIISVIIPAILVALIITGFYYFTVRLFRSDVIESTFLGGVILNSLIEKNDRKQALDYQTQLDDFRLLIKKEEDPEKKKDLKEQEKALRKEYDAIVSDNLQREDGSFVTDWRESLLAARRRLLKENERLLARNRANLTYGIIAAVLGVLILGVILIFSHSVDSLKDLSFGKIAFYYLSRVSITIIIEIVAIFFLKLYALTEHRLEKNKNEMTNIELRLTSGLMSLHKKSTNKFDSLADDLAKEERNFVLGKNETSAITDIDKLDIDRAVEIAIKAIKATK